MNFLLKKRWIGLLAFVLLSTISGIYGISKTPKSIKTIFIARCLEYQEIVFPQLFQNDKKNCSELWDFFIVSFAYKDSCNVTPEDYSRFIRKADHQVETQSKVMYWSGDVYPFVINYASHTGRYTTIRDQLAVYALDKIEDWCGQLAEPGINYDDCPIWGSCQNSATVSFWTEMSRHFASKVMGTVHVMLNASSPKAYRRNGIFAKSELTRLKKEITPELHVHLVSLLDVPPVESCLSGTLLELKEDVEKKGMRFMCSENESSILYFLCSKKPNVKKCRVFSSSDHMSKCSIGAIIPALLLVLQNVLHINFSNIL